MSNSTTTVGTVQSTEARIEGRRTIQVILYPGAEQLMLETQPFPKTFIEGDVDDFNGRFIEILDKLRKDVQERGGDLTDYPHEYLTDLRKAGKAAYNKFLPKVARDHLAKLEDKEKKRRRGLRLTFHTPPQYPLFWEMLYGGRRPGVEPEQFWGFRYPLGRAFWSMNAPDLIELRKGVFCAIHDGLEFSKQEVEQLAQHLTQASQSLGRKLDLRILDQTIPAESLTVEELLEFFHDEDRFRYGMVHFACHCENPEDAGASQSYLSLTAHREEMDLDLESLLAEQDYGFVHEPFVFLNACESATSAHLMQTISFPTGMLDFGAGGVIATACIMPDNFASAFATEFYRRLLKLSAEEKEHSEEGDNEKAKHLTSLASNIGEALLDTRLHFLEKFNNPLGLAYGLYAVSDQELRLED